MDPIFADIDAATGNGDHPHADIRKGEEFLAGIYNAIVRGSNWSSTVLIINYDEWGGFSDHVAPPVVQVEPAEQALGNDWRPGFRVPCLMISPWSRRGYVGNEVFDHTSVLKLIENRWGLEALTIRDQNANDLADVLDFDHPDFTRPPTMVTSVPTGGYGGRCELIQQSRTPDGNLVITWDATCRKILIETAPTLNGPWSEIALATNSPYVTPA